jgi:hypothetical protein
LLGALQPLVRPPDHFNGKTATPFQRAARDERWQWPLFTVGPPPARPYYGLMRRSHFVRPGDSKNDPSESLPFTLRG